MENSELLHSQSFKNLCFSVRSASAALPLNSKDWTKVAESLGPAATRLHIKPHEEDLLRSRFANYLTARAVLKEALGELAPHLPPQHQILGSRPTQDPHLLPAFVAGFAAAALLMRSATTWIELYAENKVLWRKLDEADTHRNVPRKQFTQVYRSVTSPEHIWLFHRAIRLYEELRPSLSLSHAPRWFLELLAIADAEHAHQVQFRRRDYAQKRLQYRKHSWKRRHRSSWQQVLFSFMEWGGTTVSEIRNPFHRKRISPQIIQEASEILRPGDAIVTRHADAMTNLFLPGHWPHAALYVGSEEQRTQMGFHLDIPGQDQLIHHLRTLEALKDGVRFRPLEQTLLVDAFVIIRPLLSDSEIAQAITRSASHEGKLYDFNFDFTQTERLVCTEVIYRGFDGIGGLDFQLTERSGRLNLSAEDLLNHAITENGFQLIATAGIQGNQLQTGKEALPPLIETLQHQSNG